MYINKHRILHSGTYLHDFQPGTNVCIGVNNLERHITKINRCGFSNPILVGERLIPAPLFGQISRFNAEGKYIKRKDLPMETVYRSVERTWTDWHGNEHSGYVDVPYHRYPREYVPAPYNELQVLEDAIGNKLIVSEFVVVNDNNLSKITTIINLFLEIFGECYILREDLVPQLNVPIIRLQWRILPPGVYPWERLRVHLAPAIESVRRNKGAIMRRFEVLNSYGPTEIAIGEAGFRGYVAFRFPERNINILESSYVDNATYVFGNDWEELTRLSKSEIINGNLHLDRVIHNPLWENSIRRIILGN